MTRRRQAPGYDRIADSIQDALDSSCIELDIVHDGQPVELYNLARCLDKAGLINWAAIPDPPRRAARHRPRTRERGPTISVFCSFGMFDEDPEDHPQPYVYQGSHVLPSRDNPRGGLLDLAYIPGFITRDGRDVDGNLDPQCEHEGVHPWLRLSLRAEPGPRMREAGLSEDTVIFDRDQVAALRDELSEWLLRCDDLATWMEKHASAQPTNSPRS